MVPNEYRDIFIKINIEKSDEAIMMAEESGENVRSASQWVANNMDLVNSWLPEAYRQ